MGRDSRLKANPDRDRSRLANDLAVIRRAPGREVVDPARSLDDRVRAAAMHEAGHVVAAVALGYGLTFGILRVQESHSNKTVGGYTEVTLDFVGGPFASQEEAVAAATRPDVLRVRTMQVLAGQIAESMVNKDHQDIERGSADDIQTASHFAMLALGQTSTSDELVDYVNQRMDDAVGVLTPLCPAIIGVANHLIAHANEEVTGETFRGLIDAARTRAPEFLIHFEAPAR
jgi:hypothetical protein